MTERVIRHVAIDDLKPYAGNPRTHPEGQIKALAEGLREFGFTNPMLVDADLGIIGGHGRLEAAKLAGLKTVPVVVLDHLTPEQVQAYRLADNQLALLGEWDDDFLAAELLALSEVDYDLALTGFDEAMMASLLADTSEPDDTVVDPPEDPTTKPGALYTLGEHRLLCGDATNPEHVAKVLNGEKPNLMVTDPPYGVDYDPEWRDRADRASGVPYGARALGRPVGDDRSDWAEAWAIFDGDVVYQWAPSGPDFIIHGSVLESAGFDIRAILVWRKNIAPISRGHYHHQHEPCLYAVRNGATAHWCGDRKQTTVWDIDKPQKSETGHSTQKPIECMERPIRNHSGDVYDPFVGSGTTIIAAERQRRRCFAIEIDPGYCDVTIRRWEDHTGLKAERII